ncbi:unknown [Cryptobacterium sp. CAG:338]|nr:unknown [Cryptobacterium sp. CAG:338]
MIGAAPAKRSLVVGDQAINTPAFVMQVVASPLDRFCPLRVEVGLVGSMAKLDTYGVSVAVADMPCFSVICNRMEHTRAINVHNIMDSIGWVVRPVSHMVVVACPRICGFVNHEIGGVKRTMAIGYDTLVLRVRKRRSRQCKHHGHNYSHHGGHELYGFLLLLLKLFLILHRTSPPSLLLLC